MTPAVHLCLPGTARRGGGACFLLPPPPLCMRWVGWEDDTTCAPVLVRHPQDGGGASFLLPLPPLHAVGPMGG